MADPGLAFVLEEVAPGSASDVGGAAGGAASGKGDAPVRFVWTRQNRALPREAWPAGLRLQKVRDRQPGSDAVVEQVLWPEWKPMTISGEWDDRYGGEGFAQGQLDALRDVVLRGRLLRAQMGVESYVGSVDDFDWQLMTARDDGTWWRIGYQLTMAPTFRQAQGDARRVNAPLPPAAKPARARQAAFQALLEAVASSHAAAPFLNLSPGTFDQVTTLVQTLAGTVADAAARIDVRFDSAEVAQAQAQADVAARVQAAMLAVQEAARSVVLVIRAVDPTTALAVEPFASVSMRFGEWAGGLAQAAQALGEEARQGAADLGQLVTPDVVAIYQPTASELLSSVSVRFYGTPHRAGDIARRNGLRSPVLTGDETLAIPR